jgi:hypothetical protein
MAWLRRFSYVNHTGSPYNINNFNISTLFRQKEKSSSLPVLPHPDPGSDAFSTHWIPPGSDAFSTPWLRDPG